MHHLPLIIIIILMHLECTPTYPPYVSTFTAHTHTHQLHKPTHQLNTSMHTHTHSLQPSPHDDEREPEAGIQVQANVGKAVNFFGYNQEVKRSSEHID